MIKQQSENFKKLAVAKVISVRLGSDKGIPKSILELQVSIEGQDLTFARPVDAILAGAMNNPEEAKFFQEALERYFSADANRNQ